MSEFENSPETAGAPETVQQPETATPQNETPRLTLADLLKDPEPRESAQGTGDAGESREKAEPIKGAKPKTLQALAETAKLEAKDLYDVEVPLSEGKSVKLGALKDAYAKQGDLEARELELEERRVKQDADLTRAQTELRALIRALPPKALSEQAIALVRERAETEQRVESEATMRAIPEWSDQSRRETELRGMVEMLKDYGFAPQYLQQNLNSKFMRFVRDAYLRKTRIEAALSKVQPVKRPGIGKSAPASGPAKKPGKSVTDNRARGPEARLMALLNND